MSEKSSKHLIDEAIKNIVDDRAATKSLLMGLMAFMKVSDDRHKEVGLIAAKYLETLQRSNEQLVKITALMQKKEGANAGITDKDKEELFDLINQTED
tara:strand:+ start:284 stop:577 length:294 start_codon:yes stop_codon:yes gene_type:complete